jgi:hypothetical protein
MDDTMAVLLGRAGCAELALDGPRRLSRITAVILA